jgi:deazaflavin-dependent oxidoreductase (nitroreductase family)
VRLDVPRRPFGTRTRFSGVSLPAPLRPAFTFLATPQGCRLDAKVVRFTGHSPFAYLYGRDMGQSGWRYRAPLALTTIGRRSGRLHTVGLAYYDHERSWVVVGSAGGSEIEPHWVRNLRANPAAWVHLHRRLTPVQAQVLDGEAKGPSWKEITERVPLFDKFQASVDRDIPLVVLTPRRAS